MSDVPVWRMLGLSPGDLIPRVEGWRAALMDKCSGVMVEVIEGYSTVGGGSLPGETLPTALLALDVPSPETFSLRLRSGNPPVIGRIENDRFLLDPRTVLEEEEEALLKALVRADPTR